MGPENLGAPPIAVSMGHELQLAELIKPRVPLLWGGSDADGIHAAVIDLIEIAKTDGRSERQRALAVTILGRLADRGFVSRAQIPPL